VSPSSSQKYTENGSDTFPNTRKAGRLKSVSQSEAMGADKMTAGTAGVTRVTTEFF
jgi:hypothetical protein